MLSELESLYKSNLLTGNFFHLTLFTFSLHPGQIQNSTTFLLILDISMPLPSNLKALFNVGRKSLLTTLVKKRWALIGTKSDLSGKRTWSREDGERLGGELGCRYFECSAVRRMTELEFRVPTFPWFQWPFNFFSFSCSSWRAKEFKSHSSTWVVNFWKIVFKNQEQQISLVRFLLFHPPSPTPPPPSLQSQ